MGTYTMFQSDQPICFEIIIAHDWTPVNKTVNDHKGGKSGMNAINHS